MIVWSSLHTGRVALSGKDLWVYANGIAQYETGNRPVPWETLTPILDEVDGVPSHIAEDPLAFTRGYVYRSWLLLQHLGNVLMWIGIPLVGLGVFCLLRRDWRSSALIVAPLALLLVIPIGMTLRRHVLPLMPLLLGILSVEVRPSFFGLLRGRCELLPEIRPS